jgi:predicted TIM-barrel fold metal-dependent hydrolase
VIPTAASYRPGDRYLTDAERPPRLSYEVGVEPTGYEPEKWLLAHGDSGVWGSVLFPSLTLALYSLRDTALLDEVLRVYNDWIERFAAFDPDRLKPIGMLNVDDPAVAAVKLRDLAARGFCGAAIPVVPLSTRYHDPSYQPLWEAAAALHMPLHFHVVAHRSPDNLSHLLAAPAEMINAHDGYVRIALTDIVLAGVFERNPDLIVVSVEFEGAWVPHWLQRMDWHYQSNLRYRMDNALHRFADGGLPSDYARRNVRVSFTEDPFLVEQRHRVGVDNLLWGSDFPHAESVYPRVMESLTSQLRDVPDDEIFRLTVGNAAALYGFTLPLPVA